MKVILVAIISLTLLEIGLRTRFPHKIVNESIYPNTFGDYKPSQDFISDFIRPHHIKINSLGLRGEEIEPADYRILALGDSFTFGSRVDNDQTFPYQLEKLLNKQVINAGHAAYSTREEYEYLIEKGLKLNPDMVILAWYPNDLKEITRESSWRDLLKLHYKYEPWKSYLRSSALFSCFRQYCSYKIIKAKASTYVPQQEKDWNKCLDYILKIKNVCQDKNIDFLLIILPQPDRLNWPTLRMFAENNDIDYLDIGERFIKEDIATLYLLPKDGHFSPKGNRIVAEEIYRVIKLKTAEEPITQIWAYGLVG